MSGKVVTINIMLPLLPARIFGWLACSMYLLVSVMWTQAHSAGCLAVCVALCWFCITTTTKRQKASQLSPSPPTQQKSNSYNEQNNRNGEQANNWKLIQNGVVLCFICLFGLVRFGFFFCFFFSVDEKKSITSVECHRHWR